MIKLEATSPRLSALRTSVQGVDGKSKMVRLEFNIKNNFTCTVSDEVAQAFLADFKGRIKIKGTFKRSNEEYKKQVFKTK